MTDADGPPQIRLRPMTDEEFAGYSAAARAVYAQQIVEAGALGPEAAERKAAEDSARLLPQGVHTAGHRCYSAVLAGPVNSAGEVVGSLWLGPAPDDPADAWVFDVVVEPAWRGRGIGRAVMTAAEDEVRRTGQTRIALNVWGANEVAQRLYRSLGYRVTSVHMAKDVGE